MSIWSKRATLLLLAQCDAARLRQDFVESGKGPYAVQRDCELVVYPPNRQRMPAVCGNVGVNARDFLGRAVVHAKEKNQLLPRIHLIEVIVSRAA